MDMIRMGYEQLVNAIIRPPRCDYEEHHLGPVEFMWLGRTFVREDSTLLTSRGYNIHCSHWIQKQQNSNKKKR